MLINAGVFAYHGDPRDILGETAQAAAQEVEPRKQPVAIPEPPPAGAEHEDEVVSKPVVLASVTAEAVTPKAEPTVAMNQDEVSLEEPGAETSTAPSEVEVDPKASKTRAAITRLLDTYEPTAGVVVDSPMKRVDRFELRSGQNPFDAIVSRGVGRDDVNQAFASMSDLVDFRYFRPGDRFTIYLGESGDLRGVDIYKRVTEQYRARHTETGWVTEKIEIDEVTSVEAVTGEIKVSLWNALVGQGERAALVTDFVDIFAWDVDFFSDVHPGDTFRILVEKRHADGEFIGYGNILAAEFSSGGKVDQAFIHEGEDGITSYFDETGGSLRKQLLKAPVKYANVTSGFGNRRHPILGYTRKHNGVDYGLPRGTPVWTVGDGRVVRAGWNGGYGNFISIKHSNGWVSQYAHLDKIHVKLGQRVSQKEIIGRVGSTGMSTGPHLHYELKHHGKFVNPATQRFARGKSLTGAELEAFKKTIPELLERMKSVRMAEGTPELPEREG